MAIDIASVDEALSTTRAVRLRLDLTREVSDEILLDCIDVAEQAPTGGNQGSRRWLVVRDPAVKARLAELYLASAGRWMIESRDRLAGSGHPNEKVMRSAAHLAEHLAEVPVLVVPTIIGRHDGSGRPGLFDSVIQAVWSFCVALRARGLGTTWTTAILAREQELSEALGLPEGLTPIALLPVAWTQGSEFRRAPRHPARRITFFDGYGLTWERGPSGPPSVEDGPGVVVEVDVKAPVAVVGAHLPDVGHDASADAGVRRRIELEPLAGATRLRLSAVLSGDTGNLHAGGLPGAVGGADLRGRLETERAALSRLGATIKAAAETR